MIDHYNSLKKFKDNIDPSEFYEKLANEYLMVAKKLKKDGSDKTYRKILVKYFFYHSLRFKNEAELEKYYFLASKQTKLGWLYVTQIAFNEFKESKENKLFFLDLTVKLYEKYLQSKGKVFPNSKVYLCGDLRKEEIHKTIKNVDKYFDFTDTSYPKGDFTDSKRFKEEVEKNDFVMMILNEEINHELIYELGLISGLGKPAIVFTSKETQISDSFITKVATVTTNISSALTVLKTFSVVRSGELLTIEDKSEKSVVEDLLREIRDKQLFALEFKAERPILTFPGSESHE